MSAADLYISLTVVHVVMNKKWMNPFLSTSELQKLYWETETFTSASASVWQNIKHMDRAGRDAEKDTQVQWIHTRAKACLLLGKCDF